MSINALGEFSVTFSLWAILLVSDVTFKRKLILKFIFADMEMIYFAIYFDGYQS